VSILRSVIDCAKQSKVNVSAMNVCALQLLSQSARGRAHEQTHKNAILH
jgi:hypothetical protein